MSRIHSTALISPTAKLGQDVEVGPFCVVEDDTELGAGCSLAAHSVIKTGTKLGVGNQVGEFTVLGGRPQHLSSGAEVGTLQVGDHNVFREHVTVHCGLHDGECTELGNHNLLMVAAHVAHDCRLGDHVVMTNNTMLAGHVVVGSRAYLGGAAAVHQFCRVGQMAMVGGMARVVQDVPPFMLVDGQFTRVVGLNQVGLRRAGVDGEQIAELKQAYRLVYRSGLTWSEAVDALRRQFRAGGLPHQMAEFLASGNRGFVPQRTPTRRATIDFDQAGKGQRRAA